MPSALPMHGIFAGAAIAILAGVALVLVRAFRGPTAFDRVLAANSIGTKAVILLSLLAFFSGRPEFLDTALVYAAVNFISTVALLKFVQFRRIG